MNNKIMDYVKPKDASKYYNVSENTVSIIPKNNQTKPNQIKII